jgi:hypothetical protein
MTRLLTLSVKHFRNLLLFFVPLIIYFTIIFTPRLQFLLRWFLGFFNNFTFAFLVYILLFSFLYAIIQFLLNKKKEPPYIQESSFSTYFIFIHIFTFIIFIYMLISTIFLTYHYGVADFLYRLVAYMIALLIVYIPIQFLVFIEDSNILSVLFSFCIRYFLQIIFFAIVYLFLVAA